MLVIIHSHYISLDRNILLFNYAKISDRWEGLSLLVMATECD